jgi:hypothetical protein
MDCETYFSAGEPVQLLRCLSDRRKACRNRYEGCCAQCKTTKHPRERCEIVRMAHKREIDFDEVIAEIQAGVHDE